MVAVAFQPQTNYLPRTTESRSAQPRIDLQSLFAELGVQGDSEKAAIRQFQSRFNALNPDRPIRVDGIVGPETLGALSQVTEGHADWSAPVIPFGPAPSMRQSPSAELADRPRISARSLAGGDALARQRLEATLPSTAEEGTPVGAVTGSLAGAAAGASAILKSKVPQDYGRIAAGAELEKVAPAMAKKATLSGHPLTTTFSGVELSARPGESAKSVMSRWEASMNARPNLPADALKLKGEFAGRSVEFVAQHMEKVAKGRGETLYHEINGKVMLAKPGDTAETIVKSWETAKPAAAKLASTAPSTFAKVAPKIGGVATAAFAVADIASAFHADKTRNDGSYQETSKAAGRTAGGLAGAWAGAKIGAAAGSIVAPGVGTAVGAVLGGLAFGIGGSLLGETAAQ